MSDVLLVTTYPLHLQALGGGGWVDRRILQQIDAAGRSTASFAVATLEAGPAAVPLEIREDRKALTRTVLRMGVRGEPYGVAKFSHSPAWGRRAHRLLEAARGRTIVASQFPSLLLCRTAGVVPAAYVAHNVEHVLAEQHNPRVLERVWADSQRLAHVERDALSGVPVVAVLSRDDVARLHEWHGDVRHLPLLQQPGARRVRPRTIGFLGKSTWPPNAVALSVLIDDVLPRLRAVLGADTPALLVAGRGSDGLPPQDGVELRGEVDDLASFYAEVGAVVVPRLGVSTGISVKVVEALEHGVSVVAPRAVARAAGVEDLVVPGDTPSEMAAALLDVFSGRYDARPPPVTQTATFDWDAVLDAGRRP